jgi:hypothetical protein
VAEYDLIKPVKDSLIKLDMLKLDIELEEISQKLKGSKDPDLALMGRFQELSQKKRELINRF